MKIVRERMSLGVSLGFGDSPLILFQLSVISLGRERVVIFRSKQIYENRKTREMNILAEIKTLERSRNEIIFRNRYG